MVAQIEIISDKCSRCYKKEDEDVIALGKTVLFASDICTVHMDCVCAYGSWSVFRSWVHAHGRSIH